MNRPVETVWALLSDPERYRTWVPGTVESTGRLGQWPQVGSALAYRVGVGRLTLPGRTVVRVCEPPTRLELEAILGKAGSARIAIRLTRWGRDTLVIVDEHPLRGPAASLHIAPFEFVLHLRHRLLLARLASAVEEAPPAPEREHAASGGGEHG
ncbi:SRPBCC family protein [Actinospica sp. MGRD01-02]|uniref:SRPBCC family protein n=1 Tax=Actinospica acidithermotolerans TaxID=2828514 RepID=A0A941E7Y6_9ACTN|nr:SRPBCC family protein [Actinospica acidithermotolerans]MBR7825573.1 SRPBCC family protein [Actinospica acidithermotolerans]